MITSERFSAAANDLPGDELDGLFRGFFQAEMPEPWPAFVPPRAVKTPARPQLAGRPSRWQLRSRLMLVAASVALFLAAQFLLPSFMPSGSADKSSAGVGKMDGGTAS